MTRRGNGAPLLWNAEDELDESVQLYIWRPRVAPHPAEAMSAEDELAQIAAARGEELPADVPGDGAAFLDHIGLGLRRQAFAGLHFEGGRYVGGRREPSRSDLGSIAKSLTPPLPTPDLHQRNPWTYEQVDGTAHEWRPTSAPAHKPLRQAMWRIRQGLRPLSRPRIAACGYAPALGGVEQGAVTVVGSPEGRARWCGVVNCGSVWECACCSLTINARRSEQVQALVAKHGAKRCGMLSLTIRHGAGDDLKRMRDLIGRAWTRVANGEPWKRFKAQLGVVGHIRALEGTHGPNGWHPHLHIVLLLEGEATVAEDGTWDLGELDSGESARAWLLGRWQTMIERGLGAEHVPNEEHGLATTLLHDATYLTKLGLELADPGTKEGRGDNRSPWQIASDYTERVRTLRKRKTADLAGDEQVARDRRLWFAWCKGMKNARKLVFSNGLLQRYDIRDIPDEQLAEDEAPGATDVVLAKVPIIAWNIIRGLRRSDGPAAHWILEQAEHHGGRACRAAVLECVAEAKTDSAREALAALVDYEIAERAREERELVELEARRGGHPPSPPPDPERERREAFVARLMNQARGYSRADRDNAAREQRRRLR